MAIETLTESPVHFEEKHTSGGEIICMQREHQCSIAVEITGASPEEEQILADNSKQALEKLDSFFGGQFAELFSGLHIKVGDGLTEGGAQAIPKENRIVADREKMLMSAARAEKILIEMGYLLPGERTNVMGGLKDQLGSVLQYELIHEVGHLLDEQTPDGLARKRISPEHSPTKYGREVDDWHDHKDHEAFAEGFTHMVLGGEVSEPMIRAVNNAVTNRRG